MKSSAKNIKLTSVDDIFQNDAARQDEQREKVIEIPLAELFPFKDHPFKVVDDEAMRDTAESIEKYGVLVPGIGRPRAEGGYELIAGYDQYNVTIFNPETKEARKMGLNDASQYFSSVGNDFVCGLFTE